MTTQQSIPELDILDNLLEELADGIMRVAKGKDTPVEMNENCNDSLERTKTAIIAWHRKEMEKAVAAAQTDHKIVVTVPPNYDWMSNGRPTVKMCDQQDRGA